MGLQEISERKVGQAAHQTGLPLFRAMRHSNHLWFGWVREGDGHWHVEIDPSDWDWEYEPGCQFSSCAQGTHGPGVIPSDSSVVEEHERREEVRRADRVRRDEKAATFIREVYEGTQKWIADKEAELK